MRPDILNRQLLVPAPSLPPLPLPSPREVHFWYVVPDEVKDASLLKQYMEILSPSERESILQMDKDKVQRGAVLARTLVRTTLSRCMLLFYLMLYVNVVTTDYCKSCHTQIDLRYLTHDVSIDQRHSKCHTCIGHDIDTPKYTRTHENWCIHIAYCSFEVKDYEYFP